MIPPSLSSSPRPDRDSACALSRATERRGSANTSFHLELYVSSASPLSSCTWTCSPYTICCWSHKYSFLRCRHRYIPRVSGLNCAVTQSVLWSLPRPCRPPVYRCSHRVSRLMRYTDRSRRQTSHLYLMSSLRDSELTDDDQKGGEHEQRIYPSYISLKG